MPILVHFSVFGLNWLKGLHYKKVIGAFTKTYIIRIRNHCFMH